MLICLRNSVGRKWIVLNSEFHRDLCWFHQLLNTFNKAVTFHITQDKEHIDVFVDTSLVGLGALWGKRGYSCNILEHLCCIGSIIHFEMYNVVVALAMWAENWAGWVIRINSDNMAVVHAINNLRSHDTFLATCLRNALMTLARHGIHMYAVHIPGAENREADALSSFNDRS